MNYCHVEFHSNDQRALQRLTEFFGLVKAAKDGDEPMDDLELLSFLTAAEKSYFSNLTAEEMAEWNEVWFSTPLPLRHSPEMLLPQWDFASMIDAVGEGDYDLVGICSRGNSHLLEFNPHGYPYGGTGSLVALVECFGHRVTGIDDGTGFVSYVPRTNFWKPSARRDL